MDYRIKYYKEKCTDPVEFLRHFRCTTEPIGGSTELDENGDLVDWDAAVVAIEKAREQAIDKACEWLESVNLDYYQIREGVFSTELVKDFRKALENKIKDE